MAINAEDQAAFIELRAKGLSFQAISERLGVSKPVLLKMAKEFEGKIKEQRAYELQALLESYTASKMARIKHFAKLLQAIQAELDSRIAEEYGFGLVPADKLLAMAMILDNRLGNEVTANTIEVGGIDFSNYKGVNVELD